MEAKNMNASRIRVTPRSQVRTKALGDCLVELHAGSLPQVKQGWINLDVICVENGITKQSDQDTIRVCMSISEAQSIIDRLTNHLESFKNNGIK